MQYLFSNILHSLYTAAVCYITICVVCYIMIIFLRGIGLTGHKFDSNKKAVFVTAHPDDECMFFSPTLIDLSTNSNVFVICVTTGNYYKKGSVRQKELLESCQLLGISKENVTILDDASFPDDPKVAWDLEKLANIIQDILSNIQPDFIFTFDYKGVSGHPNHIAVSSVIRKLYKFHEKSKAFELKSISMLRKYIGFLDLPISLLSRSSQMFVLSPKNILTAKRMKSLPCQLTHKVLATSCNVTSQRLGLVKAQGYV